MEYRTIRREVINNKEKREVDQTSWYTLDDTEIGEAAFKACEDIALEQSGRLTDYYNYARMYGLRALGYNSNGVKTTSELLNSVSRTTNSESRLKLNAVRAAVDTALAKIAKAKPRPMFLTNKGSWEQQQKAQKLTQYIDGGFDQGEVYTNMVDVFKNACIFGTGILYLYPEKDKICSESVVPDEVMVREIDSQYGDPQELHRTKVINRDILLSMYPDKFDLISNASPVASSAKNMIKVCYSWKLATDTQEGRYVVSLREGALESQPYKKKYFPFIFFNWNKAIRGFFGQGIVEVSWEVQLEINSICATIQKSIYFASVPRVFIESSSKVITQHIDNRVGSIVKYSGSPPTFSTPTANTPEVYNYLSTLWSKVFELNGLSEMSATSTKPAGLDAAVAIREYQDIETQRFAVIGQDWENCYLKVARLMIQLTKDLYAKNKQLTVKSKNNKFVDTIAWKEVLIEEDDYIMQCFPTNILPQQPAGRLQTVQELIQGGIIDQDTGSDLLDFPDIKKAMSLRNAAVENIKKDLERIISDNVYSTPEPFIDLQQAIKIGQSYYLQARNDDVPEERLELLRRYVDDCNSLLEMSQQQPEQPEQAPTE